MPTFKDGVPSSEEASQGKKAPWVRHDPAFLTPIAARWMAIAESLVQQTNTSLSKPDSELNQRLSTVYVHAH